MGSESLPRLTSAGELVLPCRDGGTVSFDLFRAGGLGMAGAGAANAMYALLAGLLFGESCPDVHIVGADEDLSLFTGLPIRRLRVPGPPHLTSFATHAEVLRALRTRRPAHGPGAAPPFLILLALGRRELRRELPEILTPGDPGRRMAAIVVPAAPVGYTCTLDRNGDVLKAHGTGLDAEAGSALLRGRFAQLEVNDIADLFVAYLAGMIARYEMRRPWPDFPL
ncbi:hypothetical protein GCM10010191_20860 [Actinomadura vinacea]|uniref:Uncharacterized protein n=1 Tax=Actinomadura vinacea TaxID=115336 RepID=A0ABP5VTK8_9ACTN